MNNTMKQVRTVKRVIGILLLGAMLTGCVQGIAKEDYDHLANQYSEVEENLKTEKEINISLSDEAEKRKNQLQTLEGKNKEYAEEITDLKVQLNNLKESSQDSVSEESAQKLKAREAEIKVYKAILEKSKEVLSIQETNLDGIITDSEARELFIDAFAFNLRYFELETFEASYTKENPIFLNESGELKNELEHWCIVTNEKVKTKSMLHETLSSYYSPEIVEEYFSIIANLNDSSKTAEDFKYYRYGFYNDLLLTQPGARGSDAYVDLMINQLIIKLEHISASKETVKYKVYIPMAEYTDAAVPTYGDVEFIEDTVEFKLINGNWRLNTQSKSYGI